MADVRVILSEDVLNLGNAGEVVGVKLLEEPQREPAFVASRQVLSVPSFIDGER